MAVIKYIKESKDSRLLLLGISEEGESANYTVDFESYEAIGFPQVGDMLDSEQIDCIRCADSYHRALKKALSILSYADNSKSKLYAKLMRAGFEREICAHTVERMESLGYIDERRQLRRQVTRLANENLYGPNKIMSNAVSNGYRSETVRSVITELIDEGELDFDKNKELLLEKKLRNPLDPNEKKKILFNNGYKV